VKAHQSTKASTHPEPALASSLLEHLAPLQEEMVELLERLARVESPTDVPEAQAGVRAILEEAWGELGYRSRLVPGRLTGGHLLVAPRSRPSDRPVQLLMGHMDTVWPLGTLEEMPVVREGNVLRGPGVFDMKGGLVEMVFAVRALQALDVPLPATPVAFINSDEETGSAESKRSVVRMARASCRAFVVEPSFGPTGALKTARKGVGNFRIRIHGQPAHAGLDPGAGASAIQELSHVIQALHRMTDLDRGITVNVGVVRGGTRPNVVAAGAEAEVDLRALTLAEAEEMSRRIHALEPVTPGVRLEVTGGVRVPPLERTPPARVLWGHAVKAAQAMGWELDEVTAGGGSDGNTTSQYTPTLDGLGPVGDGAHARHEHVLVDHLPRRAALLAALLASPL
jgi:glutamate carboxypeptidase